MRTSSQIPFLLRHILYADGIGRGNGLCMQSAVLLGQRGMPNIWPFESYAALKSRAQPIFERVPVAALQLTTTVNVVNADRMMERSMIDVDALLSGTSEIAIEEVKEVMKVRDLPNELFFDIPKGPIGY